MGRAVPPVGAGPARPAAVLCNDRHECLYSLGPTDRYLRVAPGFATPDLLAMARSTMRTRLRSALAQAAQSGLPSRSLAAR